MLSRHLPACALTVLAASTAAWTTVQAQKTAPPSAAAVDFARDVQPILQAHCYECHGAKKVKNGLRLDQRAAAFAGGDTGPAIEPGNSDHSLIIRRLLGLENEDQMPKDKDPLDAAQIALIRRWIDQGAPWPETADAVAAQPAGADTQAQTHWAYRKPVRPAEPSVHDGAWARTAVDRFVLARLETEKLTPSPQAAFDTLVRRVSLDLIGLPPTTQEMQDARADAARDGADAAYEHVVDRLLASPHYGERWARPWLDLARYADSQGFEKDLPRVMWKYRDWVIEALNRDMPFDQFTVDQLAGDMLPDPTTDQLIASGFHRNSMTNQEGGIDPEEAMYEVLVDRVNTTATVWLGTTLGCAQCHDHKYDPFTQKDYYRMMAFFSNNAYDVKTFGDGTRFFEETIDVPTPQQEEQRKTIQTELDRLNDTLNATTPALQRSQALWEQSMRVGVPTAWTALTSTSADASGGATLTIARDGSILASGANPPAVTYTISATSALPRITALRLEALPDASLPKGGPGRDVYGNFQVNAVEILAGSATTPSHIRAIKADDAAGGGNLDSFFPKTPSRDGAPPRGWRIDASRDDTRLPRQIVFTLEQPITGTVGMKLRIVLKHEGSAVGQAIGRFRLSATASLNPNRIVEIPAKLRPILDVPVANRTKKQREDLQAFYRTVAPSLKSTRDQIAALQKDLSALEIPSALVMRERVDYERPSAYVRRRGTFTDKREKVYAGVPETLPPLAEDQMPNRLGLARWLVQPDNPLTARVAVNHAWEQFFGRGLVETSEDFGTRGTPPTHPELLDWLATELIARGWHMKEVHKTIVMSATYRQSSTTTASLAERDPDNRLLARGPRFRMDAEMVRDTVLAASGLLSPKVGGPSVFPPQPDGIWDIPYSDEKWKPSEGEDRYRRGLYVFIRRSAPYPSFLTFDATSRERCTVRRVRTNTPLQALTALNDEAYFEAAKAMAARTLRGAPSSDVAARATYAFQLALTRAPESKEVDRVAGSYARQLERFKNDPSAAVDAIDGYAVDGVAPAEQAAWTLVANALLNLDEIFTKQ